jgi:metaxin
MKRREEPKLDATLSVRGEALNLPSMDPHCLAVVTYLKFINIKTARIETQPQANQPYMIVTDTDKKKKQITGAKSVIDHIRTQQPPSKYDLDAGLTAKQRSRYNAVMALVQESLLPSVMYYWWLYSANYSHTVAPAISSQVSFLSGLFRPGRIQKSVKQQLLTKFGRKVSKVEVFATIQKTLESISTLLNNKPFFLGQDKYVNVCTD